MSKSRKTYQELRSLRETLRREKSPFYKVEPKEFEPEAVMIHYERAESEPILDFLKLSILLLSFPIVVILMFLVFVMSVFVISLMAIKDWVIKKLF